MDKYTLKTAFKKSFSGLIWRLEVDAVNELMAVETRDMTSGKPRFSAFEYATGTSTITEIPYGERYWTLAGIIDATLIVRAYGANSPDGAGLAGLDARTGAIIWEQFNYTLVGIEGNTLAARHRNFASGYVERLRASDGTVIKRLEAGPLDQTVRSSRVVLPRPYSGKTPSFLTRYAIHGELFHYATGGHDIWAFHEKESEQSFTVKLVLSSGLSVQAEEIVERGLTKMLPELYFMIGDQIFVITDNKQKIVSYLV